MKIASSVLLLILCSVPAIAQHPEIQVIYFQPSDVDPPAERDFERITETMEAVQSFFREQMIRHGHGPKTFAFECKVHLIKGARPVAEYATDIIQGSNRMLDELPLRFVREHGERENIQLIFLGGARIFKVQEAMGVAVESCLPVGCVHWAIVPFEFRDAVLTTTAHELGHTFGLPHNEKGNAIMRERGQEFGLPQMLARYFIDAQEAEILSKYPFFHDSLVIEEPVKPPDLSLSVSGVAKEMWLWGEIKKELQ